jgi:hypothetical protein
MENNKKWYITTAVLTVFLCLALFVAALCYLGKIEQRPDTTAGPGSAEEEAVPTSTPATAGGEPAIVSEAQSCSVSMVELDSSPFFLGIISSDGTELNSPWDLRANGMASWVELTGKARFSFGLWQETSPDDWEEIEKMTLAWSTGNYNLQEFFYPGGRDLNDTLQGVVLEPGSEVIICEHDTSPHGVCFMLECPS